MSTDDTTAAEHGADAETTIVPPPPSDAPELAWSTDTGGEEPTNRHGRLIWTGLAVLLVGVGGALSLLLSALFGHHTNSSGQQPIPPATITVAAPPVTVTVAPPPTTPISELSPQQRDAHFIALVTPQLPPNFSDRLPELGQDICKSVGRGDTQAYEISVIMGNAPNLTWEQTHFLVTSAVQTYCPELASR
jgi:hypothetical protein